MTFSKAKKSSKSVNTSSPCDHIVANHQSSNLGFVLVITWLWGWFGISIFLFHFFHSLIRSKATVCGEKIRYLIVITLFALYDKSGDHCHFGLHVVWCCNEMVEFSLIFSTYLLFQRTTWQYSVFANFLGGETVIWIKNGRYSVFQSPNGDGNIQFLIESTTVTVFIHKFDHGSTVIFKKINVNTVIQNLVRPPFQY